MKALLISSSFRTQGNTALVLAEYARALEQEGFSVERVDLAPRNLGMCRGCRLCFTRGEGHCPHRDTLGEVFGKMEAADLLVLASPIYVEDVNGVMKNFIDRLAYNSHRPRLFLQRGYVVCTSGMGATNHGLSTMEKALLTWGVSLAGKAKFVLGEPPGPRQLKSSQATRIQREAKRLARVLRKPRKVPFLGLLTFHIQKMYYLQPSLLRDYDWQYWKDRGWLEADRTHYFPGPQNPIKVFFSRFLGNFIGRIVLK